MSATVRPLERDCIFWFLSPTGKNFHAFEMVDGELEQLSVCGKVHVDQCEDVPANDANERHGMGCTFCLSGVL